jgi:hypothetical protein
MRLTPPRLNIALLAFMIPAVLIVAGLDGCAKREPIQRAFYYWKTRFELSPGQIQLLRQLGVGRLFIRFFDVGWDETAGQAIPVAPCQFERAAVPPAGIVPVIYLQNRVFLQLPPGQVPALARRVWRKTTAMAAANGMAFRELQLDCDWTAQTRAAYFALVEQIRRNCSGAGVTLSATVRLHQVKYPDRTGLPPVDRVTLMFYNMGRIRAGDGPMSIYNSADARRYAASIAGYPLPMDLALPAFGWTIHSRGGRVLALLSEIGQADLEGSGPFVRLTADRYRSGQSFFLHGAYIQEGDELRVEAVGPELALEAARLAASSMRAAEGPTTVTLFDLNERSMGRYRPEEYEKIYRCFD